MGRGLQKQRSYYKRKGRDFPMKKARLATLLLALTVVLTLVVSAAPRYTNFGKVTPSLGIRGTTATCRMDVDAIYNGTSISATMTLYQVNGSKETEINAWTAYGNTSISVSKPQTVVSGQTYKLVLSATANGETVTNSVTATCN